MSPAFTLSRFLYLMCGHARAYLPAAALHHTLSHFHQTGITPNVLSLSLTCQHRVFIQ